MAIHLAWQCQYLMKGQIIITISLEGHTLFRGTVSEDIQVQAKSNVVILW